MIRIMAESREQQKVDADRQEAAVVDKKGITAQ